MVALNFQKQFAADVETGRKRQTIRENTKARAGCALQLYYGQRTKQCRKLKDAVCISAQRVTLMKTLAQPQGTAAVMGINLEEFAQADGFKTYADMWAFFEPRANEEGEFHGYLVRW